MHPVERTVVRHKVFDVIFILVVSADDFAILLDRGQIHFGQRSGIGEPGSLSLWRRSSALKQLF